jgi:tRNAThr (cytosine32-N3)-methyltransferase
LSLAGLADELALMFTNARAKSEQKTVSTTEEVDEGGAEGASGSASVSTSTPASPPPAPLDNVAPAPASTAESLDNAVAKLTLGQTESITNAPSTTEVDTASADTTTATTTSADAPPAPLVPIIIHPNLLKLEEDAGQPEFKIEQLHVDRRLLVNRKRQLKMYRVWMQGQFRKL